MAQRSFNAAVLRVLDAFSQRVDVAERRAEAAERRAAELEERVLRLERRPASPAPETVAPQPRAAALPDYFAFESRLRGSTHDVRDRQRPYVERLRDPAPVLDLGCGRGEPPALPRGAGLAARGGAATAGLVVVETIDPSTPAALRNYFADLTHAQPLVPETLELLVRGAGFRETETIHLNDSLDYAIVAVA